MAWILVPCLGALRDEFNHLAPKRDKDSDGAVGNDQHSQQSSDHNPDETGKTPTEDADNLNEVHAIDVDRDLDPTRPDLMERCVQTVVLRHRSGRDNRLQNVIYNRRIWSRSWGWTARAYAGANPHDHHAHFSARYTTEQEQDTRPWGLLGLLPAPEEDDMEQGTFNNLLLTALSDPTIAGRFEQLAGRGVHNQRLGRSQETIGQDLQSDDAQMAARFDVLEGKLDQLIASLPANPPVD